MNCNITAATLQRVKKEYRQHVKSGMSPYGAAREVLDNMPETHGCEGLTMKYSGSELLYANTGETYETTVLCWVQDGRATFRLGNWGDLVESGRYE